LPLIYWHLDKTAWSTKVLTFVLILPYQDSHTSDELLPFILVCGRFLQDGAPLVLVSCLDSRGDIILKGPLA